MWRSKAKHLLHLIWIALLVGIYLYIQIQQQQQQAQPPVADLPAPPVATSGAAPTQVATDQAATPVAAPNSSTNAPPFQPGPVTKDAGCQAHDGLPDAACTPGAVFAEATREQICQPGYARTVRNVTESTKQRAYAMYGITHHNPGDYEVDHLISLELGGSNEIANLWPEVANPKPGFHEKDKVENYLHDQLCSGAISLQEAQQQIAVNWLAVYEKIK